MKLIDLIREGRFVTTGISAYITMILWSNLIYNIIEKVIKGIEKVRK